MSSQPMTMQHSTVSIGGAPFIHPSLDTSSFLYSPSGSSSGSSSPTSVFSSSPPAREAAVAYSRMLHQHTSSMWETERLNIERSRLEQARGPTAPSKPKNYGYIRDAPSSAAPAAPAKTAAVSPKASALDVLLGRSKSKKEKGSVPSTASNGNGHRRNKSLH